MAIHFGKQDEDGKKGHTGKNKPNQFKIRKEFRTTVAGFEFSPGHKLIPPESIKETAMWLNGRNRLTKKRPAEEGARKSKGPAPKVTFEPKSPRQKDDCINRSAEYLCPNTSTLEAVCSGGPNVGARVRCCTDEKCKRRAAKLARMFCGNNTR